MQKTQEVADEEFVKFMHSGSLMWKKECCEHGKSFYCQRCFEKMTPETRKIMEGIKASL